MSLDGIDRALDEIKKGQLNDGEEKLIQLIKKFEHLELSLRGKYSHPTLNDPVGKPLWPSPMWMQYLNRKIESVLMQPFAANWLKATDEYLSNLPVYKSEVVKFVDRIMALYPGRKDEPKLIVQLFQRRRDMGSVRIELGDYVYKYLAGPHGSEEESRTARYYFSGARQPKRPPVIPRS